MPEIVGDDLLTTLFTYSPREKCKPKENFCTQALVWCLQNSIQFRRSFLELAFSGVSNQADDWQIESQFGIKLSNGKQRFLDIYAACSPFHAVIECKVESRVEATQLDEYLHWLRGQSPEHDNLRLICLTKRKETTPEGVIPLRWEQIYRLLSSESKTDGPVGFIARCFTRFLKEQGMAANELEKLPPGGPSTLQQCHRFWRNVDELLNSFKNDEELEDLSLKKPTLDEDTAFLFKGVYSPNGKYYAGVGLSVMEDSPCAFLWVEFTLRGDCTSMRKQFSPSTYEANLFADALRRNAHRNGHHAAPYVYDEAKNETYFAFAISFDQFDGNADRVKDWWRQITLELLPIFKGAFVP